MKFIVFLCLFVTLVNIAFACECGMEGSSSRIYRGKQVRAHKYPWLAHIRIFISRRQGYFAQCGGSLIDEQHVALAAHCVTDDDGSTFSASAIDVYLGLEKAFTEKATPYSVSEVYKDTKYDDETLGHDFAILKLSTKVKTSNQIAPICLPNSEANLTKLTVAGWGTTGPKDDSSNDLLEVEVDYLTNEECNELQTNWFLSESKIPSFFQRFYDLPEIEESHMCAINKKTLGDACAGDSGGPLMYQGSNGRYYLMGVVSGSWTECGESKYTAGLYTRTAYYKDYIQKIATNACWQDL